MVEHGDLLGLLPEDTLADVLRRLVPRDLATARCVRKALRDIVDDRRLLLPHLLPHKVGGIFINFHSKGFWELFSRPSAGPVVSGWFHFVPGGTENVFKPPPLDHCKGLFLFNGKYVFNPATRKYACLPPRPPPVMTKQYFYEDPYLLYDPAVSPHYEVFLIHRIAYKSEPRCTSYRADRDALDPAIEKLEWPPSPYVLHVFSSKTAKWEQRSYLREGEGAGTVADVRFNSLFYEKRYAIYLRGELYFHCEADFVMRISLLNNKFQVIKPPKDNEVSLFNGLYLGRSKTGIQCAKVDNSGHPCRLRIWILKDLRGQMEWLLMHQANIGPMLPRHEYNQPIGGSWMLQDLNYYEIQHKYYGKKETIAVPEKFEWESDNDDVLETGDRVYDGCKHITFLGFHPYKDVVFLAESSRRGLAYHWNSSKIQLLGNIYPKEPCIGQFPPISETFLYTPCWMEELPLSN
ncbi:hypothetical protein EJB05_51774, partial [Eragrostis curvula]